MAEENFPNISYPEMVLFLGCSTVAEKPGCSEYLQGGEVQECISECDELHFSGSENR